MSVCGRESVCMSKCVYVSGRARWYECMSQMKVRLVTDALRWLVSHIYFHLSFSFLYFFISPFYHFTILILSPAELESFLIEITATILRRKDDLPAIQIAGETSVDEGDRSVYIPFYGHTDGWK